MSKFRGSRRLALCIVLVLALFWASAQTALASSYGRGSFGTCQYQKDCPPTSSTRATLPSGLEISVNLVDGQTIPRGGYLIVVTPLNGQGASFKQADFYINGQLAKSVAPDQTGTAEWLWDPSVYPGETVKIVVTGIDGSTVTKQFRVKLAAGEAPQSQKPATGISAIINSMSSSISKLPKPIAYSFPYILFVLLGINILLLLVQARRELKEYRTLQALLNRGRAVADSKRTLIELVSHYLRTPLTVLSGGIDMLKQNNSTAPDISRLEAVSQRLYAKIEQILSQTQSLGGSVSSGQSAVLLNPASPWRNPGLFVPLILIALVIIPFNYLAAHADTLSISQVNLTIQGIIFAGLVVISYQVFRNRQLRRRDRQALQQLSRDTASANQVRDTLIASATQDLSTEIKSLDELIPKVSGTPAGKYIQDGQNRFHDLLGKFTVARSLQGSHSTAPMQAVQLNSILDIAFQGLESQAAKRGITIKSPASMAINVQNPELVAFVLSSLLDNAIAYSPNNSSVEITVSPTPQTTVITVTDHGQGLTPEKLQTLFQPFSKAEGAESFTHQGMGFNLYLSKVIMTYLGGSISLESQPGKGTAAALHLSNHQQN